MNYNNVKLATYLFETWQCDDQRDFNSLKKTISRLLQELNINSAEILKLTVEAYRLHAEIDDNIHIVDEYKIRKIMKINQKKCAKLISKIFEINGAERFKEIGEHHAAWWFNYILKNHSKKKKFYVWISWHILMENYYIIKKLLPSIICAYYLIKAGLFGHDQRNKEIGIKILEKYWQKMTESGIKPLMI